jgi:hypothetical protein
MLIKLPCLQGSFFLLILTVKSFVKKTIIMRLPYFTKIFSVLFLFFTSGLLSAQTGPSSAGQDSLNVFTGSGVNQLLIPIPDSLVSKNIQPEVASSDTGLLEILDVDYTAGQPFVLLNVKEKNAAGEVNLTVNLNYEEETVLLVFEVHIMPYNNPGMVFEIHDIVFWQEAIPLEGIPVYETVIDNSAGPYNQLNYDEIPLTVNMDCSGTVCTGNDFYTSFYRGYLIPPADGTYHFYMRSADKHTLWLSPNEDYTEAEAIVARSNNHGNIGSEIGNNTTKSQPVTLEAGKVYAIYATQWIIHSTYGGIMWDGPGIDMQYIPGENLMPEYDINKPSAPANLDYVWRSSTSFFVDWSPSTDENSLSGYNLYVNGIRTNEDLISETSCRVEGLADETIYYLAATAVDQSGNESFISNILEIETYQTDSLPPVAPQQLDIIKATGLALHIRWSGASDAETEVIGYNLYINEVLYNTNDLIFEDSVIIHNLTPETEYLLTLESVDAGMNASEKSNVFNVSTVAFDPSGPNLGEHVGKAVIYNQNTSWNEGIGLNGPYENGDIVNNAAVRELVEDFEAGAIRWGAISANSKSFQGSVGSGKSNTYGKMLNMANEIGARFALTVGVQNGIDYRTDPNTFLHLLEYLAGDASTTWGAVRAAEGFNEPLLQQGKGILLEFGNEVWGAAAHDAEIGSDYAAYAKWVREMSDVVRSSPYYDPEKIIMVYSGRYPHPDSSYGVNTKVLTGDRGHVESLGVSGYLGGNLTYDPEIPKGKSELDYYKNGIGMSMKNMEGFVLTMKEMFSLTGTLKTFYLYESNMTTTSYNGRFGQAIVMTDYLANSMNYGSIVPSIFHLTGGQWRITQPADNYNKLPLYYTGQFFNRFCKGHILETEFISNNKLTNSSGQTINADAMGTYAYNDGENFSILLLNRDFENDFTLQLELPEGIEFFDEAMMYTIWEDDFSSFNTNIDSVSVTLSDDLLVQVPKHAMVIISIQGEDPGYEKLPLGYYDRIRPDSLAITSSRNFIIDTDKGTDVIRTVVLPSDAFSTAAVLDVIENTTESILTPLTGGRLHIKGSGVCGDEGFIRIHVYAADNHELTDTVTVQISNQGIDCPATNSELIDLEGGNLFNPNPVSEVLYLNKNLDSRCYVQLFDHAGRVVYQNYLHSGYEIPVNALLPGMYIIAVLTPDGKYISEKLMKK